MSSREKLREKIFGVAYTIMGILALVGGISTGSMEATIAGIVFFGIAAFSWIKLAVNSPGRKSNDRPVKQNAAHLAREAELEEQKRQRELAHQQRKESYLANPVPLKIRKWDNKFNWDWKYNQYDMDRMLYIYQSTSKDLSVIGTSFSYRDRCRIYRKEDGIWYLRPVAYGIQVRFNNESARNKCEGLPVNTQEFSVPRDVEQELIPGDCITIIDGTTVCYFRVDQR